MQLDGTERARAEALLATLVGEHAWGSRVSADAVLRMDFGAPRLRIREPSPRAQEREGKVRAALERRLAIPTGRWHLFVEAGAWAVHVRDDGCDRADAESADAVFFAGLFDWQEREKSDLASKAGFNPAEPRHARGRWSSQLDQDGGQALPRVIPIASADDPRGNKMAKAAATAAGLNREQRRKFHDEIMWQGITDFQELLRRSKEIAAGGA